MSMRGPLTLARNIGEAVFGALLAADSGINPDLSTPRADSAGNLVMTAVAIPVFALIL